MSSNLFNPDSLKGSGIYFLLDICNTGGGYRGSMTILNALSIMAGSIFESRVQDNSIQGLVLHSISHTLKFSSIIKSRPKISMQFYRLDESNLLYVARKVSIASCFFEIILIFFFLNIFWKYLFFI